MRAVSTKTSVQDPYRAGLQLGEALRDLKPEIAFLFTTIGYTQTPDLLEGFHDGIEHDGVLLVGCSGDGFLETSGTSESGAAILGLHSDGRVRWKVGITRDIDNDPASRTREALTPSTEAGNESPVLGFLFSDFRLDASQMEKCLESIPYPVFGGLAADDFQLEQSFVIANHEFLQDAMVTVLAYGDLSFNINIGNALTPVGSPGVIDASDGKTLLRIDGLTANEFIERETGKPVLSTDVATTSLQIIDEQDRGIRRLRSIASGTVDGEESVNLFGGIENGKLVQVCNARAEDLIAEAGRISAEVRDSGFVPTAGLIVSCVGRKGLLGDQLESEVRNVTRAFAQELPIAGFPSFGEIGPLKKADGSYTRNLFHNMTYVLLLFGQ